MLASVTNMMKAGPVRMAMIGGGPGSFIGPIHRMAARTDGDITLVAAVPSRDPAKAAEGGRSMGLAPDRVYADAVALLAGERARPASERAEFVAIVTPNDSHAAHAIAALEAGFAVLCDKPMARDLAEAQTVRRAVRDRPFGLTYTYLGYPLVEEARALVAAGALGRLRRIDVRYTQGWLSDPVENTGNTQAAWRTDPVRAGISGCLIDIGVHAQSLAEWVSGERIVSVAADIRTAVPGRLLDDDAAMLIRTDRGTPGTLIASQVATGDRNRLEVRLYGEAAGLAWAQEEPNALWLTLGDAPPRRIECHAPALTSALARQLLRTPAGHPEGYLEAFANLYGAFARQVRGTASSGGLTVPDADHGVHSLAFVEAALASSRANSCWTKVIA